MAAVAHMDRGGLYQAFCACMETPCIARKLAGMTFAKFCSEMRHFTVLSFYVDGEPAGAAMFRGGDGHIAIRDSFRGRWANRRVLKAIYQLWGSNRHATVDTVNAPALDFVQRMGLKPAAKDGNLVRFA